MYKLEEPFALLMLAPVLLIGCVLVPLTSLWCLALAIPFAAVGCSLDLSAGTLYGFRKVNSFTPISDELVDDDEHMLTR